VNADHSFNPSFDVRCWTFDVRCSFVSFSIKLAAFQASGGAETSYETSLIDIRFLRVSFVDQTARFAASGWADTRNPVFVFCPLPSVIRPLISVICPTVYTSNTTVTVNPSSV
jgi:hypothetical protein